MNVLALLATVVIGLLAVILFLLAALVRCGRELLERDEVLDDPFEEDD